MHRPLVFLLSTLAFAAAACAPAPFLEAVDTGPDRIATLQTRLRTDSTDAEARRDLGIVYVHMARFDEAADLLRPAFARNPHDLYGRIYYGVVLDSLRRPAEASALYAHYRELPSHDRMRRWMAGRYLAAQRAHAHQEIAARVAAEDSLQTLPLDAETPPRTVAIFPLRFLEGDPRYAPLGRGLSTLLLRDLAQVEALTVLERIRLDVLLSELSLSEDEVVLPGTAPRVGRLLRARHVVGGGISVASEGQVRLSVAMRDVIGDEMQDLPQEDLLSQLYALEKDLVFDLLDAMNIEPSPAEREAIEVIPTRDLQALLAFSQGLQAEEAGRHVEAARFFRQALALDPEFGLADEFAEQSEGIQAASGNPPAPPGSSEVDLLRTRHQKLVENLGALLLPGQDKRDESPGEAQGDIGRPPVPPPRGN